MKTSLFIILLMLMNFSLAISQITNEKFITRFDTEIGYQFNNLTVYSPDYHKHSKGWLFPKNSLFIRMGATKSFKRFDTKLSLADNRFIYFEKSFTLPVSYVYVKSDFIQILPSIEKTLFNKFVVFIGVDVNYLLLRRTIWEGETGKRTIGNPPFESIFYSSKTKKVTFGLDFGLQYKVNKWGIQLMKNFPLSPAAKYLIKADATGVPLNNLHFLYSNMRIGLVYHF